MREVAAACGILAGSLYHHFPSKEAIAVELIEDYHADLDRAVRESAPPGPDPVAALRAFARDIAQVSSRHRAALQITLFDAPASASTALKTAVHDEPASVERHWGTLISAAAAAGAIGAGIDRQILRHVLHCTTRQVGGVVWERGGPRAAADCTTAILFDGLASSRAARPGPGGAPAVTGVVDEARARWATEARERGRERRGAILEVARDQFALRGFEATTMRDIADAAGLPAGNLYRYYESKDAMVTAILSQFSDRLLEAYQAVLAAGAPAVESVEAICWLLDQAGRHFSREIDMLKGHATVLSLDIAAHYREGAAARYAMLAGLIEAGVATGEFKRLAEPALVASCVREIMWAPMRSLAAVPPARVRDFCRHCVLAGAARHLA
jgi:AcrR family transcriptional regulator